MKTVYEQADFFVIDKPSGISVHNEPGSDLVSRLAEQFSTPVYAIHRLDRYTSGVLLCTNSSGMVSKLQSALSNSKKQYLAIVRGVMSSQAGEWDYRITDKSEGRRNPQGIKKYRKEARTSYKVLDSNQYFSCLSLTLHSGRQHQIRKHCAMAGHEILGDTRYGDKNYQKKMKQRYGFEGFLLHAHRLQFSYGGAEYDFSCSPTGWDRVGFSGF